MKLIACSSARLWTHMPMHTISGLYGILLKPEGGMTPCPIYPYGGRIRRRPYPRCTMHGFSVTDLPHPEAYTAMPCRLCMRFHMYKHSVFF